MLREGPHPEEAPHLGGRSLVNYICGACGHLWRGRGRKPGGQVRCPKCRVRVYTYAKAAKPPVPEKGKIQVEGLP